LGDFQVETKSLCLWVFRLLDGGDSLLVSFNYLDALIIQLVVLLGSLDSFFCVFSLLSSYWVADEDSFG